jgi:uncharacterized protein (DUF2141 family)
LPTIGLSKYFKFHRGRYGGVSIHDENSNMKLDRNFFGISEEGFGFSNNPRAMLSAPVVSGGGGSGELPGDTG